MSYSFQLTARVLLYESSHRQDNIYHGLCYTSRGALAGTRNSSKRSKTKSPLTVIDNCFVTNVHDASINVILEIGYVSRIPKTCRSQAAF